MRRCGRFHISSEPHQGSSGSELRPPLRQGFGPTVGSAPEFDGLSNTSPKAKPNHFFGIWLELTPVSLRIEVCRHEHYIMLKTHLWSTSPCVSFLIGMRFSPLRPVLHSLERFLPSDSGSHFLEFLPDFESRAYAY